MPLEVRGGVHRQPRLVPRVELVEDGGPGEEVGVEPQRVVLGEVLDAPRAERIPGRGSTPRAFRGEHGRANPRTRDKRIAARFPRGPRASTPHPQDRIMGSAAIRAGPMAYPPTQ